MRTVLNIIASSTLMFVMSVAPSWAGEVAVKNKGSATWAASPRGPWIDLRADGSVSRIYSRYSTPVEFADRRGINKAQVIAEEKAKAEIIRFLNQTIASTRVVTEIQNDLNKATQERQTGTAATVKKVDSRVVIENLTEVTASFAAGNLTGVIVLENGYDDKTKEAWVVVGMSEKTINAARAVQKMNKNPKTETRNSPDSMGMQPSESRKSPQKDW
jgi:hypothetical protein